MYVSHILVHLSDPLAHEYQLACVDWFQLLHEGHSGDGVGNHPNSFFTYVLPVLPLRIFSIVRVSRTGPSERVPDPKGQPRVREWMLIPEETRKFLWSMPVDRSQLFPEVRLRERHSAQTNHIAYLKDVYICAWDDFVRKSQNFRVE